MTASDAHTDLVTFVYDPDLQRLETLIAAFNIFEAVGAVRQELRHSDFLSFLFDPSQNHGLDAHFLKRFLMRSLMDVEDGGISPIQIDLLNLDHAEVRREWQSIDILIHDAGSNLVAIIENKVDSSEHDEQLQRYYSVVERNFPGAVIVPIYLTPDGDAPTDERYVSASYSAIAELLSETLQTRGQTLDASIRMTIAHYVTLLRRHIVTDSDIAELAKQIYRKHQRAIDLIIEHRPDLQDQIREHVTQLIQETPGLMLEASSTGYIRFLPEEWTFIPELTTGTGWGSTARILLFEFVNSKGRLIIKLTIGPGPQNIRETLYAAALNDEQAFRNQWKLGQKWATIYRMYVLSSSDYEEATLDDLVPRIDERWEWFVNVELPPITRAISEIEF